MNLVDEFKKVGARHNATPGQIALAWLLAQRGDILPIPGTRRIKVIYPSLTHSFLSGRCGDYLVRSICKRIWALNVKLSKAEVDEISELTQKASAIISQAGAR